MSAAEIEALRALYRGTDAEAFATLRSQLPDLGDGLQAQMQALHNAPSEAACELLARNLEGARRHVLRLAEAIRAEVKHGGG